MAAPTGVMKGTYPMQKNPAQDHPKSMEAFYMAYPSYVWAPILVTATVYYLCNHVESVVAHFDKMGATPYGVKAAATLGIYAITVMFASHGWYCTFVSQDRQFQAYEAKSVKFEGTKEQRYNYADKNAVDPRAQAVRATAALITTMMYSVVPFAPATTSWASFIAWTAAFAVYWDLHFYIVHMVAHENRHAYTWLHKLHHIFKASDCFGAYFVTYQSHFFTEHSVVLIMAALGLPVDVFNWTLYYGTIDTYIKHGGHTLGSVRLPLMMGMTWEQLNTILSPWGLILGGATTGEHDWHHEKFTANYALSFTYLDKLFGSYHPGRVAGECLEPVKKPAASAKATDTNVVEGKKDLAGKAMTAVDEDGTPIGAN